MQKILRRIDGSVLCEYESDLREVFKSGKDLNDACFKGEDLVALMCSDLTIKDAVFDDCDMYWADFERCRFMNTSFRGASMQSCYLKDCIFENCDLKNVTFGRDSVGSVSKFVNVDFRSSNLDGVRWEEAQFTESCQFPVGFIPLKAGLRKA